MRRLGAILLASAALHCGSERPKPRPDMPTVQPAPTAPAAPATLDPLCRAERFWLNFGGTTANCGEIRDYQLPYNEDYYCDGRDDEEDISIEAFRGSSPDARDQEIEGVVAAIRCVLEPFGIEALVEKPDDGMPFNTVNIGGAAAMMPDVGVIGGRAPLDLDNRSGSDRIDVTEFAPVSLPHLEEEAPWGMRKIFLFVIHEVLHALGLDHSPYSNSYVEDREVDNECGRRLSLADARTIVKNTERVCRSEDEMPSEEELAERALLLGCRDECNAL